MAKKQLRELDRSRPYAEVYGLPGAKYEQDDILFLPSGLEAQAHNLSPVIDDDPPVNPEDDNDIGVGPATVVKCPADCKCKTCVPEENKANAPALEVRMPSISNIADDYENMHWTQLRKTLEMFGGEWVEGETTKETAIAYLRGQKAAA